MSCPHCPCHRYCRHQLCRDATTVTVTRTRARSYHGATAYCFLLLTAREWNPCSWYDDCILLRHFHYLFSSLPIQLGTKDTFCYPDNASYIHQIEHP